MSSALVSTIALAAAASARRDYRSEDRLSNTTQALMWPAYIGAALLALGHAAEARSSGTRWSHAIGAPFVAAGIALFAAGAGPFRSFSQLTGRETGDLITGGIYRYSRNPQYVGNILISSGAALAARSAAGATFAAVGAAAYLFYVPAEEAHLERVFGTRYRDYRRRTPRWLGSSQVGNGG